MTIICIAALGLLLLATCLLDLLYASTLTLQGEVGGKVTVVLLDYLYDQYTYSSYLDELRRNGYKLTILQSNSNNFRIIEFGEVNYDNIILFCPQTDQFRYVTNADILQFIEDGGNLLLAVDEQMSPAMKELALHCGVEFDEDAVVVDHFAFHQDYDQQ